MMFEILCFVLIVSWLLYSFKFIKYQFRIFELRIKNYTYRNALLRCRLCDGCCDKIVNELEEDDEEVHFTAETV